MKQVKIKSLEVTNFKGQTFKSDFDCDNVCISGKNKSGKSTHIKAWLWLLTGLTDAVNNKNHELYDNTKEITQDTPTAVVEAIVNIDGYDYTIKRTATASFSRKRNEETYTKDASDKYVTYIDGVEYKANDFKDWISANLCDSDVLPYALYGEFFANLTIDDMDKARKLLESLVGDVKNEELKGDYSMLFKMLERFTLDELINKTKANRLDKKRELESIPMLIEQKEKDIAVLNETDFDAIKKDIQTKNKEVEDIDNQLKGNSDAIKPILDARNKRMIDISNLQLELGNKRMEHQRKVDEAINAIKSELLSVEKDNELIKKNNQQIEAVYDFTRQALGVERNQLDNANKIRETLLKQVAEIKGRKFEVEKCAYCGQDLPEDKVNELQTKFNEQKAKELKAIIEQGKKNSENIDIYNKRIAELRAEIDKGLTQEELKSTEEIQSRLDWTTKQQIDYTTTQEYKDLSNQITELENNLPQAPQIDNDKLSTQKEMLMLDLATLNKKLGTMSELERNQKALDELVENKKNIGVELAKLEKLLSQIEAYKEEKAKVTSDKINNHLQFAHIQTEQLLKSGERKPACIITDKNNVKYATTNTSDRILICADLQKLFCKLKNISLPLFLDEVSVIDDDRVPIDAEYQTILIARKDCKLTISKIKE